MNIISLNFYKMGIYDMSNIYDRVKKIISDQLGIKLNEVENSKFLMNDLGADSLDVIELIMALEEEFNIEISDDIAEKINTVQSCIDCVINLKKK